MEKNTRTKIAQTDSELNGGERTERFRSELRERKQLMMVTKCVFQDTTLTPTARVLFSFISNLTFKFDYCYASNEKLAELVGVCETTFKKAYKVLKDRELIIVEMETVDKRTTRKIFINYIEIFHHYLNEKGQKPNITASKTKVVSEIRQKYKNLSNN